MRTVILAAIVGCATNVGAQIAEIATLPGRHETLRSLELAGPKIIQRGATGFSIYNPDLTLFDAAVFPSLPLGFNYGSYPVAQYVTESLFDTDPTTIEYMIGVFRDDFSGGGTLVARIDGNVLLLDTVYSPGGTNGQDLFTSSPSIIQTDLGPRLLLNQGINTASRIYALPGTLPCISCSGDIELGAEQIQISSTPDLRLFPNPSTDSFTLVVAEWAVGSRISVFDASGKQVLDLGQIAGVRQAFLIDSLSAGHYQVVVQRTSGAILKALPLIREED